MSEKVESVNPNVEVSGNPTVDLKAGDAISFDDMEQLVAPNAAVKSKGEKSQEEQEQDLKGKVENAKAAKEKDADPTGKENEEESEEESEEGSEEGDFEKDKEKEPTKGPQQDKVKVKFTKFKDGDKIVDVSDDAVLEVRIDGKKEAVPLQQLKDNYSGKVNWDRKYNELHQQKTGFENQRNQLVDMLTDFAQTASRDPMSAFDKLCKMTGVNSEQFRQNMMTNLQKEYETLANMNDEQREAHFAKKQLEHYKKKDQELTAKQEQEQRWKQYNQAAAPILKKFSMSGEDYMKIANELGEGKDVTAVHPEQVAQWHASTMAGKAVESALKEEFQGYYRDIERAKSGDYAAEERQLDFEAKVKPIWEELTDAYYKNPQLTQQDLVDIINEVFERPKVKSYQTLSRKVQKAKPQMSSKAKDSDFNPTSFDELS